MNLTEALLKNRLQIQVVWEARPRDQAAEDTARFFHQILTEDHGVEQIRVERDKDGYQVRYRQDGEEHHLLFDRLQVEQLLASIEAEPRYGEIFHRPGGQSKKESEPFSPHVPDGQESGEQCADDNPDTERSDKDVSSVSFPVKYPP